MAITRIEIDQIITLLTDVSNIYLTYERNKKKILTDYRGNAMENELKILEAETNASVKPKAAAISRILENLIEETKKGNDYDVNSPAVSDAAKLLSAEGISMESAEKVIEKFKGNQVALELLKASAHESYYDILNKWIFDSVGELNKARNMAMQLTYENPSHYPGIAASIRESVQSYAWHQGIELGYVSDSIDRLRIINISAMLGLDPDEL